MVRHQEQYPVINLSLKSARQPTFELAYVMLKRQIMWEYSRHRYILEGDSLTAAQKEHFKTIMDGKDGEDLYIDALEFLSYCLAKYHHKNVIILLDEYDVPLENAYFEGFYDEMVAFIRSLFESALKTNSYLEFAVITGCLRISRESIFTGLNNLDVYSVLNPDFEDSFGFTEKEVRNILSYYGLEHKYSEIKKWYNGYYFGDAKIYNPWSIMNHVKASVIKAEAFPKPYWSNTSSNSIIKEMVAEADFETRRELEELIAGGTIEKAVHEDITYEDIHDSKDNLWNFLFFTGYLKKVSERYEEELVYLKLSIPNREVLSIYRNSIMTWFEQKVKNLDMTPLYDALENGACEAAGVFISEQLLDSISFYDYSENYYHGFLTGLLKASKKYGVYSNRESGTGRPDIILKTHAVRGGRAFILELKVAESFAQMEHTCKATLKQIESRNYEAALTTEGYQNIKKYGICFYRKECLVMEHND